MLEAAGDGAGDGLGITGGAAAAAAAAGFGTEACATALGGGITATGVATVVVPEGTLVSSSSPDDESSSPRSKFAIFDMVASLFFQVYGNSEKFKFGSIERKRFYPFTS